MIMVGARGFAGGAPDGLLFSAAGPRSRWVGPRAPGTAAGPPVAAAGHDGVVEFSSTGRVLAASGRAGSGPGQLNRPVALAVTPFGDVWVADQANGRVVEFSAVGRYRVSFAVPAPSGVALDARGDVWVSRPGYALTG